MRLNELLRRLDGVKGNDSQYSARCPVPDHGKGNGDRNQSLSVRAEGNNILLKCHVGCATEDILKALGLEGLAMSDTHKSVVRNEGYTREAVSHIERHNERKNENYSNLDVVLEQSHNNIHYKACDGTYLGEFDRMIKSGEISTRGLKLNNNGTKAESNIVAEMMFDVNTEYFETYYESHGYKNGYDFAKAFYGEAYKMAVAEVGDEKYILSATMHADERNKGLSEQLGRDVYHYHLHVVYIPIVQKEIKWTKRCKDPALVGTVKEIINQVNHSKKWESEKMTGEDGKEHIIYSYSKLQDRYFDHMANAGYRGFERGKVGSTAQNLSVLEYEKQLREQELAEIEKELAAATETLEEKIEILAVADKNLVTAEKQLIQTENKIEKLSDKEKDINGRIKSIEDSGQMLTLKQIEKIETRVHAPLVGYRGVILSEQDEKNLRTTAMASAKMMQERDMFKNMANTLLGILRDIIQAVISLKYNFAKKDKWADNDLLPEQEDLITAIYQYGQETAKNYGENKMADEMGYSKIKKPVAEKFNVITAERQRKNEKSKPSFFEILEANKIKSQDYNARNNNTRTTQRERKTSGDER